MKFLASLTKRNLFLTTKHFWRWQVYQVEGVCRRIPSFSLNFLLHRISKMILNINIHGKNQSIFLLRKMFLAYNPLFRIINQFNATQQLSASVFIITNKIIATSIKIILKDLRDLASISFDLNPYPKSNVYHQQVSSRKMISFWLNGRTDF